MVRVAINGMGRIGRLVLRRMLTHTDLDVVAVNASYPPETIAHLVKYDTVHGRFSEEIRVEGDILHVAGRAIRKLGDRDPERLPWGELGVDVVVEATGAFTDREGAEKHLRAGAKRVVITAPAKGEDATLVIGVNHETYDPEKHRIISNASCTTNGLAPVAKVLHEAFGIEQGIMTTVHAYTSDQRLLDNPHPKDLRRARGAALAMVPTTTGAAKAIGKVIPALDGKLTGMAVRVPVPNVSLIDLFVVLEREVTKEEVNAALRAAAEEGPLRGILGYTEEPLVSSDFNGEERSSIVDGLSTLAFGRTAKVMSWYDNEWGYSARVVDLVSYIAARDAEYARSKGSVGLPEEAGV
ncbi:MAG: NAD-dependent glyceraldehyde-3-phosphate dehydrogenase [Brockia lithotrophica]|uniref:Glyceraldehyde-3-phosphate dehydrogenase n=1 Tax=Brockia lithotrophica TaxID=933949 RepID=A0A2T5GAF4_9BACL|nr:type I glyceraldehyde-3-phosphate dehydrogenase [Brockia lithotrophica]MBT9253704.1 type I glyceraldehyde-3-phosphate dehydrogenase [Brockia lithotrophica]PTQ53161.1 MAG: NAD-dependent glyceraldehyde-3-phosphate dehydrogenase [Brockia lithotrophica]